MAALPKRTMPHPRSIQIPRLGVVGGAAAAMNGPHVDAAARRRGQQSARLRQHTQAVEVDAARRGAAHRNGILAGRKVVAQAARELGVVADIDQPQRGRSRGCSGTKRRGTARGRARIRQGPADGSTSRGTSRGASAQAHLLQHALLLHLQGVRAGLLLRPTDAVLLHCQLCSVHALREVPPSVGPRGTGQLQTEGVDLSLQCAGEVPRTLLVQDWVSADLAGFSGESQGGLRDRT
mmetsp:Transcript_36219/g.116184  ORF Transcript_36219/g.116184 Transcript_36219/m.116184 type:complete len:236 (-) Transcript_36219:904-1611(-)